MAVVMDVLEGAVKNSTHRAEVVPVELQEHPYADSLSIVKVFDGYTVVVRTSEWKDGDLGVYIPPDSIVNTSRPEFAFLTKEGKSTHRVKAQKLRGIPSMGLLIKPPTDRPVRIGQDFADYFGIEHYVPPQKFDSGECIPGPEGMHIPVYDLEALRRYASIFRAGEEVVVTEKIHGTNARFLRDFQGVLWAGSRQTWKKFNPNNIYWKALLESAELRRLLVNFPGMVAFGEVYGDVQDLKYGRGKGQVSVAIFDLLGRGGQFINPKGFRGLQEEFGFPTVPVLGQMRFDLDNILALAEGESLVAGADHIREGVVVKPVEERFHAAIGRVALKAVGNGYLERAS